MLGLWNIDKLLVYQFQDETHTLVAGTNNYTIGSGATIDTTRPVRIESAYIRDSSNYDTLVNVINKDEYDQIGLKTTQASNPDRLFYDPGFANGTIYLYPTPSAAYTLHIKTWKPFSSFSTLATSATFPPGYNQFLIYNLAVLLGTLFRVPKATIEDLILVASDTKEKIETLNNQFQSGVTKFDSVFSSNLGNDRELLP